MGGGAQKAWGSALLARLYGRLLLRRGPGRRIALGLFVAGCVCSAFSLLASPEGWMAGVGLLATFLAPLLLLAVPLALWLRGPVTLAIMALATGVQALVVVIGVGEAAGRELSDRIAVLNGEILVQRYGLDFEEYEELAQTLARRPGIARVQPFVWGPALAYPLPPELDSSSDATPAQEERVHAVVVKAVRPGELDPKLVPEPAGAALRPAGPREAPTAWIGEELARKLDLRPGDRLVLSAPEASQVGTARGGLSAAARSVQVEVSATVRTGLPELDAEVVMVHLRSGQALFTGLDRVTGIELGIHQELRPEVVAFSAELHAWMRTHYADSAGRPRYRVQTWLDGRHVLLRGVRQMQQAVALILALIEVVAGTALAAALALIVRTRRGDIGVLSILGMPPGRVFWLFEAIGVSAGALGGLTGLLAGAASLMRLSAMEIALQSGVYPLAELPAQLVPEALFWPLAAALLVAAIFSGPAALLAARASPLELVRR